MAKPWEKYQTAQPSGPWDKYNQTPAVVSSPTQEQQEEQPSLLARAADVVTGNLRETETTRTLPEWTEMPELNDVFSVAGWKTALGTLMSNPAETVQVIQANHPDVKVRQDEKGNYVMFSPRAGREFAIPPGFSIGDIPRAGAALASFTPAGRATSIAGAGAASAATQGAIEATQAASGGEFSPSEVVTSGLTGAALPAVTKLVSSIRQPLAKATGQAETPIMMQGVQAADNAPVPAAPAPSAPTATPSQSEEFGTLVRKAAKGGIGSASAKEKLAELAAINPEAKEAAEKLGVELPVDVMTDNRMIQESMGLSRSMKGSTQSAEWYGLTGTVQRARERADEVIRQAGGDVDIATASETVKQALNSSRADMKKNASVLYKKVDSLRLDPKPVRMSASESLLSDVASKVGGLDNMKPQLKKLFSLASDPTTTYGRLDVELKDVGAALRGKVERNPYGDVDTGLLKRIYGAMKEDQLNNVRTLAGDDAASMLIQANGLTARQKVIERRLVNGFGKEGEGSIAAKLKSAISTGSKGDIGGINKMLQVIPPELRKETIMSAIADLSRTRDGLFAFGQYSSMYQGLRKNTPVYAALEKEIGKDSAELLRSLYVVSNRLARSEAMIPKTGAGSAALLNQYAAQGTISKILERTAGPVARTVAPVAGVISSDLSSAIVNAAKHDPAEIMAATSKLFTSPEFTQLIADVAERGAEKAAARKVAISPSFAAWANRAGLPKGITVRERWLRDAMLAGKQFNEEQK